MALSRLVKLHQSQRVLSPLSSSAAASVLGHGVCERTVGGECTGRIGNEIVKRFATAANDKVSGEKSENKDVAVSQGKRSLFPRRQRRRGLWRDNDRDFVPALYGTLLHSSTILFFLARL